MVVPLSHYQLEQSVVPRLLLLLFQTRALRMRGPSDIMETEVAKEMGSGLKKRSSLLSWNFRVSMSDKSAGSITFDAGNNPFTTRMVRLLVRRGTGRRVRGHTL